MSFLGKVERAREALERHRRVSLDGLERELQLDEPTLDAIVAELVDVQQVAAREGKVLAWIGPAHLRESAAPAHRPVIDGERRQLTVMFCDLVGSTALSERLDAEDLGNVVRAYQETATQAVESFEGHVAQYLGDGMLVYFGYPRAHEDDAERAVRAGLELHRAIGRLNARLVPERDVRLAVRIGVHTGPVVVGEIGEGAGRHQQALGATTNIAARLTAIAEPDALVISGATLRLAPGMFRTQDLGTPPLKGIRDPIRVHAVLQPTGIRSRLDGDPSRLTPLVGRDREVGLLLDRWAQARAGHGNAVAIGGEAGIGKSRLLRALRERLGDEPHTWLECHCSRYTQGSAFHPLVELLEQGVEIGPEHSPDEKVARLERAIGSAGLDAAEGVPLLAPLLSVPVPENLSSPGYSPELRYKKTIELLAAWVLAVSDGQPLLMLVEDLHWCDPSTLEFLALLIERCPNSQVLTLLSFRPEFEPAWAAKPQLTPIEVGRLDRRQAEQLIGGMTRERPFPEAVLERIVERADGVPLFLEELTRMVQESGLAEEGESPDRAATLAIPSTLQDSLMARLDRLGPGREVAQLGAVLGRNFSYALLRAVSGIEDAELERGLESLVDAEVLVSRGAPPDTIYSFRHALIQDTAYQCLLRSARREVHARTAKALEELFPARAAAEPGVVARHYDEARLVEPAVDHYQRAARRAILQCANEEAIAQLRRALEILESVPESEKRKRKELELLLAIGVPLYTTRGWADPDYGRHLERARVLVMEVGNRFEQFEVWTGLYLYHQVSGDLARAEDCARRALELADPDLDHRVHLLARAGLSQTLYLQGDFAKALEHLEQAIALYESREGVTERPAATEGATETLAVVTLPPQPRGDAGHHLQLPYNVGALCRWALGYPDQALALCDAALESARRVGPPFNLAVAHIYSGWIHQKRGNRAQALIRAQNAIDLCEQLGFSWLAWAMALRGAVREYGEGELAVADIRQGIAALQGARTQGWIPHCFSALAEVYWSLHRYQEALEAVDQGLECGSQTGQSYEESELRRLQGEILCASAPGETGAAEAAFETALDAARRSQAKSLELRAAISLAHLWHRQGRDEPARDLLEPVHAWFSEGFDTRDWREAKMLLESLH